MNDIDLRGATMYTRQNGQDIRVRVIEIQQTGKHRGKWACESLQTHRRLWRSARQLRHSPALLGPRP